MNRASAVACVVFAVACDDVVVLPGDAGFVDGGVDVDAGIVVDGGVDAGVEDCVIDEVDEFAFVENGTEDLVDPRGDAPYPDVDVLAMWSRMEGDTWVVEVQFAAPPFRRNLGLELGWGLDRRPALDLVDVICDQENCALPPGPDDVRVSGTVSVSADFGPFPPDAIASVMRDNGAVVLRPTCDFAFVTPHEPYLQLRFGPEVAPTVRWAAPYHWVSRHHFALPGDAEDPSFDHSWSSVDDPFFVSRGGAATPTEPFVSVCDLTCDDLLHDP